uniref:Uncharacterized protein n=1 Tax=Ralstonia solanacearum TaxID=305 RepID=A0A0S4WY18_RALSL|nr:protein of unknown function [Ralstonia solanacearum]
MEIWDRANGDNKQYRNPHQAHPADDQQSPLYPSASRQRYDASHKSGQATHDQGHQGNFEAPWPSFLV